MRTKRRTTRSRRAFSLLELVIVLSIILIVAAIAVPRYAGAMVSYRITAAGHRLRTDVQLARAKARQMSSPVCMEFDPLEHTISIYPKPGTSAQTWKHVTRLTDQPYESKIYFVFASSYTLTFDGYGRCGENALVALRSGRVYGIFRINQDAGVIDF